MKDLIREYLSYPSILIAASRVKRECRYGCVYYGSDKEQYFLYFEPKELKNSKIIVWIHGGGWNTGSPKSFDYVGECIAREGYRLVSIGYRLSPKYKYPCQLKDVCDGYNTALDYLKDKGIDTNRIIVAGPSAGAHLASILCYSRKVQERYNVDISNIIGFVGSGGPYSFRDDQTKTIECLQGFLFRKGYDRRNGEPVKLMSKNHIPMLLIQSKHDGLIEFECAEDFKEKATRIGNNCEIYVVEDKKDSHSYYTVGMFTETREKNKGLNKFFSWIESL